LDLGIQQVIMPGGNIALNNSVASSLESQGIDVVRLAGQDASDTSTQIARFELAGYPGQQSPLQGGTAPSGTNLNKFSDNPAGLGWNYGLCRTRNPQGNVGCNVVVALARGDYFADALTSSVFTGNNIEPILLTEDPNTLGGPLTTFFNQAGSPYGIDPNLNTPITPIAGSGSVVTAFQPFGGPLALADSTIQAALNAISAG